MSASAPAAVADAPDFDGAFQARLMDLVRWRRDVRRFRREPVVDAVRAELLEAIRLAPSVGLSEPWRIVAVESLAARAGVRSSFAQANSAALAGYEGERARCYAGLKLAGLDDAPVQWALFADMAPAKGHGLGRATMPEMAAYSVACAVMQAWLVARAQGLGIGWVSIIEPANLTRLLDVPPDWRLVAYLCIGWPAQEDDQPELARAGWETRDPHLPVVITR